MPSEIDAANALGEGGSPQADRQLAQNFGMTVKQVQDFDPQTLDVTRACKFLGLPLKRFDSLAGQPEARDRWVSTVARERKELIELFPQAGKEMKEMLEAIRKFALRKCLKPDSPAMVDGIGRRAASMNFWHKVPTQWLAVGGIVAVALLVVGAAIALVSKGWETGSQGSGPGSTRVADQSPSGPTEGPPRARAAANDTVASSQSPSGPDRNAPSPGAQPGEQGIIEQPSSSHAEAAQGQIPALVKVGPSVEFQVSMTTSIVVPVGDHTISQVRVYHALPTRRPWHNSPESSGLAGFSFLPKSAVKQRHEETKTDHLLWRVNDDLKPGSKWTFTTLMTISSPARSFDPSTAKVSWKDYETPPSDPAAVIDSKFKRSAEQSKTLADLKTKRTPPEAIAALCELVQKKNVQENGSVKPRRDWGRMLTTVYQTSHGLGIPMRIVGGMNLTKPDARADELHAIRGDCVNVHRWAEVWFPGIGWVEVDPSRGSKAFSIPAEYVQSNRYFENYEVWYMDNKKDKLHNWSMFNGKYVSDLQLENIISFTTNSK